MRAIAVGLLLAALAAAGDVTERGRGLDRALDLLLAEGEKESNDTRGNRLLILLIDPTPSLKQSGFAGELRAALHRNAKRIHSTRIAVAAVGAVGRLSFKADPNLVANSVEDLLESPRQTVENVYADVRKAAKAFPGRKTRREIVLVTLENGDAEDNLEATIATLRRASVRLSVIAREAFLSDSYWAKYSHSVRERCRLTGPDSAFIELPWGWILQRSEATETVPSGFAMYGLTRMAAETDGRVFLHYPVSTEGHECTDSAYHAVCAFCDDDHRPAGESYRPVPIGVLAPHLLPRRQVLAEALRDPFFRATQKAWENAAKAGFLRGPPYRLSSGKLKKNQGSTGWPYDFRFSKQFAREALKAEKLLRKLEPIRADLQRDLAEAHKAGGNRRWRAVAEYMQVMLHVTRVNLRLMMAFCREVAPWHMEGQRAGFEPPEVALYELDRTERERIVGFGYYSLSLCHGVKPFRELRLAGLEPEIDGLEKAVEGYLRRYAHTPFAMALRRAGLTRYYLAVEGRPIKWKRRMRRSKSEEVETEKENERPTRDGTTPGTSAPTTSGGG